MTATITRLVVGRPTFAGALVAGDVVDIHAAHRPNKVQRIRVKRLGGSAYWQHVVVVGNRVDKNRHVRLDVPFDHACVLVDHDDGPTAA